MGEDGGLIAGHARVLAARQLGIAEVPFAGVIRTVAGIIVRAQARAEVAPGDPRLHAFSLMGPMVMAMLFREVFGEVATDPPDLQALAGQHARTALNGLLTSPAEADAADGRRTK